MNKELVGLGIYRLLIAAAIERSYNPDTKTKEKRLAQASRFSLAPATGFEPVTIRLTAERSTTELRRNMLPDYSNCFGRRCKLFHPRCAVQSRNRGKYI